MGQGSRCGVLRLCHACGGCLGGSRSPVPSGGSLVGSGAGLGQAGVGWGCSGAACGFAAGGSDAPKMKVQFLGERTGPAAAARTHKPPVLPPNLPLPTRPSPCQNRHRTHPGPRPRSLPPVLWQELMFPKAKQIAAALLCRAFLLGTNQTPDRRCCVRDANVKIEPSGTLCYITPLGGLFLS